MLVPQGYDLKALERIGHLGAVFSHLDPFVSTQGLEVGVLRHLTCGIKIKESQELLMKNWKDIIAHHTIRYLDHTSLQTFHHEPYTALHSFAIDDALALSVSNRLSPPIIRLWVHENTIVLGIPDGKLPYCQRRC